MRSLLSGRVPPEEGSDGFGEASALGLSFLAIVVCSWRKETQRHLRPVEMWCFGCPMDKRRIIPLQSQDTIDTTFDPPALTLAYVSPQDRSSKCLFVCLFLVYFHCISAPIPLQWAFGPSDAEPVIKYGGALGSRCCNRPQSMAGLTGGNVVAHHRCGVDPLTTPLPSNPGNL